MHSLFKQMGVPPHAIERWTKAVDEGELSFATAPSTSR